ncbi:toll/interleukin-1 receptor domain-containing protein [Leptospira meyeri]|uniref:toll/interleukin-1 receptor domain-containing protein n=1 Tax=Leptospira meyeri TaxID=29508 RepID=UPI000C2A3809|nr:toll/interleukin-1 receptor domain-containing protein [Leptospira meyeri]PKA24334.1 hypothetical protein CH381_21300 [Leptospira sp. mixed culture ATI2-C-A1]TGM19656.1 tetratricopeptide repeat protein [Leptospira meyeri]
MKFFLSYSWKNNEFANIIETKFDEFELTLTRDIHDLKPLDDMNIFMESGHLHDAVILMITSEYLTSINCMYEACHIYSITPEKILPVVDGTIDLVSTEKIISILKYWEDIETQEEAYLKKISLEKAFRLNTKFTKLKIINLHLAKLLNYIQRIKYINLEVLASGDSSELEYALINKFNIKLAKPSLIDDRLKILDKKFGVKNSHTYYEELEGLLIKYPNSIKILARKITYKFEIGLKTEAEKELNDIINKYPDDPYLTNLKGCMSIEHQRNPIAAIKYFERTIAIDPTFVDAYYNLGTSHSELNNVELSIEYYKKCIELRPNHFGAWLALGWINWNFYENIIKASECFEIGLKFRSPESKWLLNYATFLSEALNNHQEAVDIYLQILKDGFKTSTLILNLSLAYLKLEKYEDALFYATLYEKEIGEDSNNANNLAEIYEKLFNDKQKSELYYKKAIELNKSNEIPYRNYAMLLTSESRFEDAEKNLLKAIELNPQFYDAKNDLAILYIYKLNKVQSGLKLLNDLTYTPNYYELSHYNLGLAYMDLRMFHEAKVVYQEFIKKYPGDVDVINKLAKIEIKLSGLSSA